MKKLLEKIWNFAKRYHIFTIIGVLSLIPTVLGIYCGFLLEKAQFPHGNPYYHPNIYSGILFNLSSIISAIFIVCIGKKLLQKKKISEYVVQNKQLLISCWINISYFIYMSQIYASEMFAIRQGVYPPEADSIAIPMFSMLFYFIILGFFYYCLMNVFLKKLYLNELSQKTTKIIAYTLIVVSLIGTPITAYYSYHILILEILEVIWIMIMLFIVRYNSELSQNEDIEKKDINFNWALFILLSIIFMVCYFIPILAALEDLPFIAAIILTFMYTDRLNDKIKVVLKKIVLTLLACCVLAYLGEAILFSPIQSPRQIPRQVPRQVQRQVQKTEYNPVAQKYIKDIQKKIKKHWRIYDKHNKGKIVTRFKINSNGEVSSIKIISSNVSKNEEDRAIETIEKSAPFKPLPKDLNKDGYVDVEFTFDLN